MESELAELRAVVATHTVLAPETPSVADVGEWPEGAHSCFLVPETLGLLAEPPEGSPLPRDNRGNPSKVDSGRRRMLTFMPDTQLLQDDADVKPLGVEGVMVDPARPAPTTITQTSHATKSAVKGSDLHAKYGALACVKVLKENPEAASGVLGVRTPPKGSDAESLSILAKPKTVTPKPLHSHSAAEMNTNQLACTPSPSPFAKGRRPMLSPNDSFDTYKPRGRENVPAPYKYAHPTVRGKQARGQLKGFMCGDCAKFYKAANLGTQKTEALVQACSKHRALFSPAMVSSPQEPWKMEIEPDAEKERTQKGSPLKTRAYRERLRKLRRL